MILHDLPARIEGAELPEPDLEDHDIELWGQNAKADFYSEAKLRAALKASADLVRAALAEQAAAVREAMSELQEVASFLNGSAAMEGFWFGDSDTARQVPRYWWRASLRAAVAKLAAGLASPPSVAALPEVPAGWVSAKDDLPPLETPVWALQEGSILQMARVDDCEGWLWCNCYSSAYFDGEKWRYSEAISDDDYQPTMWQLLPAVPSAAPTAPTQEKPR